MRSATGWCVGAAVIALLGVGLFWPRENVILKVKSVEPGSSPISRVAKMELVNGSRRSIQYHGYPEGASAVQHGVLYKHPQGWIPAGGFPQVGWVPPPVTRYVLAPGQSVQFEVAVDPAQTWKVEVYWSPSNWRGPPAFVQKLPLWASARFHGSWPKAAISPPVKPRNAPEKHD